MFCLLIGASILLAVLPLCHGLVCGRDETTCKFKLVVEPRLTMMDGNMRVMPANGGLYYFNDTNEKKLLSDDITSKILTTDGVYARLVIAINDEFPGPDLIMYEDQAIEVEVVNQLHTDSITVHFHGMHQRGTPWSDGVAYVTQCPILPGSRFIYRFKASPAGTHWYHAHIGDQRSMGLYGPLIVKKKENLTPDIIDQHIMIIQDWNHDMDPETAYQKMIYGIYDCDETAQNCSLYVPTESIDGAQFSRFEFHSGLVNGKGRYHYGPNPKQHNGAPLTKYTVQSGKTYRFRVISAATLYPFRVFVSGHRLTIIASDGRELRNISADSFIIQSGERYDFLLEANQSPSNDYMIIAESLEVGKEKMHIAEAILQYASNSSNSKPVQANDKNCTKNDRCIIFNCPFRFYPSDQFRNCTTFNFASGITEDSEKDRDQILNATNIKQFFLNFAFPGEPGNTPGSVNGRQFVSPNVAALTQPQQVGPVCDQTCGADKICSCAYSIDINSGDIVELVLLNMGRGSGWSHPVHIHGHSFYVMLYGFPDYDTTTGKILAENDQVECVDDYCNVAKWRGRTKRQATRPFQISNRIPPLKDTVIVPTGGYVQVRFKADNPGVWFLHCHIDLHNTNGMAMMINESFPLYSKTAVSDTFPKCGDYTSTFSISGGNEMVMRRDVMSLILIISYFCSFMSD